MVKVNPLHPGLLPPVTQVWAWLNQLNNFGPRLTGNAAHKNSIGFLQTELQKMGFKFGHDMWRDTLGPFKRWEPTSFSLSNGGINFSVSSYFPYSGSTSPKGIKGELVYYARPPWFFPKAAFRKAANKIALVEVPLRSLPRFLTRCLLPIRDRFPNSSVDLPAWFSSPLVSLFLQPNLEAAKKAGVKGVVCVWRKCSDGNAAGQYLPFFNPTKDTRIPGYPDLPAVWVNGTEGNKLRQLAKSGGSVRLTLQANIYGNAQTDSLWAELPGTSDETIIINTHTDGPNACEENGVVGLLALASYFSKLTKQQKLKRTLIFVFVTGHFQLPQLAEYPPHQATHTWLKHHGNLWDGQRNHQTAVAAVTLEHLGCMEWKDNKDHTRYGPTGEPELELVYASNSVLNEIYLKALQGRKRGRVLTLKPLSNLYFGEGEPLYEAGIPTLSLCPLPDYLCAAEQHGQIGKLDKDLMHDQIETFAKVVETLDGLPAGRIGKPERRFSLCNLAVGLIKRRRGL